VFRTNRFPRLSLPLLLAGSWLAAAWLAGPITATPQGGAPTPVRVDDLRLEEVQQRRLVTGSVRAVRRSEIATREAGLVLELGVREGQPVEAGAVLARLDSRKLELELGVLTAEERAAQDTLSERRSDEDQARRDLEAIRSLAGRDATNPKELADAETAVAIAVARAARAASDVAAIGARKELLQQRVEDLVIRAPFAGSVVRRLTEVGEWLGEGAAVAELVSTDQVEAWLEVPQALWGASARGDADLQITIEATGATLSPSSSRAVADVDPRARTFALVAPLPAEAGLAPGMSVTAWVPTSSAAKELTVSRDALLRNATGPYVYVASDTGDGGPSLAVPTPVEVLFQTRDRVVVRAKGLAPGTPVVVEGNERLFPMAPIQPIAHAPNPVPQGRQPAAGGEDDR